MTLAIAVAGINGRVGQRLAALIGEAPDLALAGGLEQGDTALPPGAQVVVDFSSPEGFGRWLGASRAAAIPFVSGTTGLADADLALLDEAAEVIPVLHATNTSLGVAVLNRLAAEAARMLGADYDIEIVESHHRHKKDAPSGTAQTLAQHVLEARGRGRGALALGRRGMAPREAGSIGVHSLRLGDVVGEHTVHFAAAGERLELTHKATSRDTFAQGALRAARWIVGKPAGRYGMADVLGLGRQARSE
jgi:4-hydroxy-tetrahydrodipicolinate reductase